MAHREPARTRRVLQVWAALATEKGQPEAAALRQAIATADWDTVERHGGLDADTEKILQVEKETDTTNGAGWIDDFRLRGASTCGTRSAI